MKKNTWTIIGVVVIVLLGASFWYAHQATQAANEGIEILTHVKGNPDATVVLAEYSDFQCPACAAAVPVVKDLLELHGDEIRFEYKHFPLQTHPFAVPAAVAAEAAGQQGKFFEMHDLIFEHQTQWSRSANPRAFFIQYAEELELDMDQFRRQLGSSMLEDKVRAELTEAMTAGYRSTPTFVLDGQRVTLTTYGDLLTAVESAIGVTGTSTTPAPAANPAPAIEFGI